MLVIAWGGIAILDAEAIRMGQTPIMPGLKAMAIQWINHLLAVAVGAINGAIATVYGYRQLIALVALLLLGGVVWRWRPATSHTEPQTTDRWNAHRVRHIYREL